MISPISFAVGNLLLRQGADVSMFDLFALLCPVRRCVCGAGAAHDRSRRLRGSR